MALIDQTPARRLFADRRGQGQRRAPPPVELAGVETLFQPQFAARGGALVGAEALARYRHPQHGLVSAGLLFAAERPAARVSPLVRHLAHGALAAAAQWPAPLRLSLNVSAADLAARDIVEFVEQALAASCFAADRLTLEITEQSLVNELDRSADRLARLAALGVRIALDDFGAGFCNFHYLKRLPLHYLKLDRSMIEGIEDDPRDLAVLRGIVTMANALGLEVVAEGVEREAQRAAIEREGCAAWQGFLGAQAMSAAAFAELANP